MAIEDRYEVKGPMGEGGFARVFRGEERATGRPVALKILKSDFYDNAEVRERFQREVFAVASLSNAHIVGMYDFGLNEKDVYIAMEYVAGQTLREMLRSDLTIAQRFTIIAQILDAVGAAHARDVVHRDLKPENVKIVPGADGTLQVKVLDFGMAKLNDLESRLELAPLTRAGVCFGTPQYMSPEQIRGKLDDSSIDLFAVATMAYELFAGHRPWDASDPYEVMRAVLRAPAPPIDDAMHGSKEPPLSKERLVVLNAFFERALAKSRDRRPADACTLAKELEAALFGDAGAPMPATFVEAPAPMRPDDTQPHRGVRQLASALGVSGGADTLSTPMAQQSFPDTASNPVVVDALADVVVTHAPPDPEDDIAITLRTSATPAHVGRSMSDEALREEVRRAAAAFSKTQVSERGLRALLVPLLIIAAIGGSVGYFVAGAGSAQASALHDFLVGKK